MGFGRAIVAALLVAAGASAAGNVSLVPSGFTSAEMVKRFHGFGGWHVEDRSCDKYVYGRLWDADCMKRRPPAGEILPLLVTGTPYTGTRSVAELFAAMDVEVDHEAYADMATVSSVHAFNDFVGGVPYPRSSEQTPWWKTRIISNRYDYQNAFRPRWKHAVHLTRCPLRVVQRLMGAGAPVIRFLEAFTEWPRLRYRCAEAYACDAPWEERLGWAVAAYVALSSMAFFSFTLRLGPNMPPRPSDPEKIPAVASPTKLPSTPLFAPLARATPSFDCTDFMFFMFFTTNRNSSKSMSPLPSMSTSSTM